MERSMLSSHKNQTAKRRILFEHLQTVLRTTQILAAVARSGTEAVNVRMVMYSGAFWQSNVPFTPVARAAIEEFPPETTPDYPACDLDFPVPTGSLMRLHRLGSSASLSV